MTEALRDLPAAELNPFSDDRTGNAYFDSEPHYRLLAANIREQLQQGHGLVLVLGNPAPSAELLARQLALDTVPRCRATVVKGGAQLGCGALMRSFRKLHGISIAEKTLKRVPGAGQAPVALTRGQELDILVLDNFDALADEVIEELCASVENDDAHRPGIVLLARESMVERLASEPLAASNAAITARFHVQHLARQETAPFIGFQIEASRLDDGDLFKPPIVELIGIYADGDPHVVNELAERVLNIARLARVRAAAKAAASVAQTEETATVVPLTPALEAVPEPSRDEAPVIALDRTATESPADQSAVAKAPAAPIVEKTPAGAETTPAEAIETAPIADQEPVAATAGETAAPAAAEISSAPVVTEDAAASAAAPDSGEVAETPSRPTETPAFASLPLEGESDSASASSRWTVELPRGFEGIEETSLPEALRPEAVAQAPVPDLTMPDLTEPEESEAPTPESPLPEAPSAETTPDAPVEESAGEVSDADAEAAVSAIDSDAEYPPRAFIEENVVTAASDRVEGGDRFVEGPLASARDDAIATEIHRGPITMRRAVLGGTVAALAAIALIIGFDIGHLRSADRLHLQAKLADVPRLWQEVRERATAMVSKSGVEKVAVPPAPSSATSEPAAQPPRTPPENRKIDLRLGADTTGLRTAATPTTEPPAAPPMPHPASPSSAAAPASPPSPPARSGGAPVATSLSTQAEKPASAPTPEPVPAPVTQAAPAPAPIAQATPTAAPKPAAKQTAAVAPPAAHEAAGATPEASRSLLLGRGDRLLASGDIIAARHYFELVAAEAGDREVALRLGKTYDPIFLKQIGARGIAGDAAIAKSWYLKAIAAGDRDADMRLLQLMALYPE